MDSWLQNLKEKLQLGHQTPFVLPIKVDGSHIDNLNHVNNEVYLTWMLQGAIAHAGSLGFNLNKYKELGGYFVVRRHEIDYLAPALEGDDVRVATWIGELGRSSIMRHYHIFNATQNRPSAEGLTKWIFVDINSGRPKEMPKPLRAIFEPYQK